MVLDLLGQRWALRVLWELRSGALTFRRCRIAATASPRRCCRGVWVPARGGPRRSSGAGYAHRDGASRRSRGSPSAGRGRRCAEQGAAGLVLVAQPGGDPDLDDAVVRVEAVDVDRRPRRVRLLHPAVLHGREDLPRRQVQEARHLDDAPGRAGFGEDRRDGPESAVEGGVHVAKRRVAREVPDDAGHVQDRPRTAGA